MTVEELKNCTVKSITTAASKSILGKAYPVIDEGSIFRIADLHVIRKTQIEKIEENNGTVKVVYKNGDVVELEVQ
jgi:hypothetical protein